MFRDRRILAAALLACAVLWVLLAWPVSPDGPGIAAVALPAQGAGGAVVAVPEAVSEDSTLRAPPASPSAVADPSSPTAPSAVPAMGDQHLLVMEEMFAKPQGPLDAFRHTYETEPRDSAANDAESRLRAAFEPEQASSKLLRSVLCRQSICRLELRWRASEMGSYVAAMGRIPADFEQEFAAVETPAARSGEGRAVELFIKRKRAP